jgi:hypothetical protein
MSHTETERDAWNESVDAAGPLYSGGEHAPADIVGMADAPTLRCGSICTGTVPVVCC